MINQSFSARRFRVKCAAARRVALVLALLQLWTSPAHSETTRSQTIQLHAGWNAVFLEVYPANSDPTSVFANTPVDIVASYYEHNSSAQFMANPGVDMFRKSGWGVWYAGKRPDAFLKTLFSIYGQQPYLIHSKAEHALTITGEVHIPNVQWRANAYNFVGFSVRSPGGPTFAQFFAGSAPHRHNKLYRLTDGAWRRVLDPSAESMRSGEAFWVYCDGASQYQGPLKVGTTIERGLFLGSGTDSLTLRNETENPITPTLEHVPGGSSLPLSIVIRALSDVGEPIQSVAAAQPNGPWVQAMPALEAGAAIQVPFELRQQDATAALQGSLLKVTTDVGTEVWLPVIGVRKDLEDQ